MEAFQAFLSTSKRYEVADSTLSRSFLWKFFACHKGIKIILCFIHCTRPRRSPIWMLRHFHPLNISLCGKTVQKQKVVSQLEFVTSSTCREGPNIYITCIVAHEYLEIFHRLHLSTNFVVKSNKFKLFHSQLPVLTDYSKTDYRTVWFHSSTWNRKIAAVLLLKCLLY